MTTTAIQWKQMPKMAIIAAGIVFGVACTISCSKTTNKTRVEEVLEDLQSKDETGSDLPRTEAGPELRHAETASDLDLSGCPTNLFSDEICGHGQDVKSVCSTCSEDGLRCVHEDGKGEDAVFTVCTCDWFYQWDEYQFQCYWQRPLAGQEPCFSSEECSQGYCLRTCHQNLTPFCGIPCDKHSDCEDGHYCDLAYSVEWDEVGRHCMPNGVWTCHTSCGLNPGHFLCSCTDDSDCYGICVPGRHGSFCTNTYDEGGCGGYTHLKYMVWQAENQYDWYYACLDRTVNLCMPCMKDSDCELPWVPGGGRGDKCVSYGDAGSFCGIDCGDLLPDEEGWTYGYECVDGQYVSESGTCDCPAYHVELAAATICKVTNEYGCCEGTRMCTEQGLSDCDAPIPGPETCDGVDNDCDGVTDEDCP